MPAEGAIHQRCDLPDGAIVTSELEVVGYLDPESGDTLYTTRLSGETTTAVILGHMEMAKHDILTRRDEQEAAED